MSREEKGARIVFVGCGLIGQKVIAELAAKLPKTQFTLIDPRQYFENNVGSVRSVVARGFHGTTVIGHEAWLPTNVRLVIGAVTSVTKEQTVIVNGTTLIPFDFLVLQSGSRYPLFKAAAATLDARSAEVNTSVERIKAAKSVLVVGGGQVGVEVAAEIAAAHKGKKVTIVHPHQRFVHEAPPKLHNKIAAWFKLHSVTTILGERVILDSDAKAAENKSEELVMSNYKTDRGSNIDADLVLRCTGAAFNSSYMLEHWSTSLNAKGQIKVNNTFAVEGAKNIFAVGDISNADPCPLAASGQAHIPVIVANIASLVNAANAGKSAPTLKTYTRSSYEWGPGTSMGPELAIICLPLCCGTVAFDLAGAKKTEMMVTKPAARATSRS